MPAIHSFDIGLIGCKVLNIRSVCVMLYLGNFPNSPTHKSMEKDCLITEAEKYNSWKEEAARERDKALAAYAANPSDTIIEDFKKFLGNK